jgi:hypothetical protein
MAIVKRLETDILYAQFKHKGRRYLRSTGTTNHQKAEAWERRFRAELEREPDTPALTPTLAVLRDLDVARLREEGRSEAYITRGIINNYKWLIHFFPDVSYVTAETLQAYVKHRRRNTGTRRQTIAKELTTLKRGFSLAQLVGPAFWPKLSRDEKDAAKSSKKHSLERFRAWLALLTGEARDIALFALLTGLRREELYRVRPQEDIDGSVLTVREKVRRQNGRRREVWLSKTALAIVPRLPFQKDHKKTHKTAALADGVADKAGTNITLRDCRAAFATAGDRAGDSRATDLAMGHSGIPARYQKSDYERLRKVAEAVEAWLLGTSSRDISG